jgi:rhomboid protease GluP
VDTPKDNDLFDGGEDAWSEIQPSMVPGAARKPLSQSRLRTWMLVLEARGIPAQGVSAGWGWRLLVPTARRESALYELERYEKENRGWPPRAVDVPLADNRHITIAVLLLVGLFHNLTQLGLGGLSHEQWMRLGGVDAGRIVAGEWWRTVTSLTLHTGGEHLLGNLLLGGFFVVRLCREMGTGAGWCLLLLSGAAGNYLNALVQPSTHLAVGASTAVFGAIGLLAGLSVRRNRHVLMRRWPLPLAAALGLIAMLGTGGERTDIGAHLFGFASGVCLGLLFTQRHPESHTGNLQRLLALIAASVPVLSWWAAFS